MVPAKVRIISRIESPICQNGTSVMAILVIIRIGEKKGIIELTTESVLSGLRQVWSIIKYAIKMGAPTGSMSCCVRSEEHTSELQSRGQLVCRLLLEKREER